MTTSNVCARLPLALLLALPSCFIQTTPPANQDAAPVPTQDSAGPGTDSSGPSPDAPLPFPEDPTGVVPSLPAAARVAWARSLEGSSIEAIAHRNGTIVVGTDTGTYLLSATGQTLWHNPQVRGALAVNDSAIFVYSRNDAGQGVIVRLAHADGHVLAQTPTLQLNAGARFGLGAGAQLWLSVMFSQRPTSAALYQASSGSLVASGSLSKTALAPVIAPALPVDSAEVAFDVFERSPMVSSLGVVDYRLYTDIDNATTLHFTRVQPNGAALAYAPVGTLAWPRTNEISKVAELTAQRFAVAATTTQNNTWRHNVQFVETVNGTTRVVARAEHSMPVSSLIISDPQVTALSNNGAVWTYITGDDQATKGFAVSVLDAAGAETGYWQTGVPSQAEGFKTVQLFGSAAQPDGGYLLFGRTGQGQPDDPTERVWIISAGR